MEHPTWTVNEPELAALSNELDGLFQVERARVGAGGATRAQAALPRPETPLVRLARALTGVVLLASLGVLALGVELAARQTGAWPAMTVLRVALGAGTALMALLLAFAAPNVARLDARVFGWLTGRVREPGALDVVMVRLTALAVLTAGGWSMLAG